MSTIVRIVDDQGYPVQGSGAAESAAIEAENTFTDEVALRGRFNVTVSGTFVATVTLQRSYDGGDNWHDRAAYTVPTDTVLEETERDVLYRIGVKTGGFTSGTADVRLGQ